MLLQKTPDMFEGPEGRLGKGRCAPAESGTERPRMALTAAGRRGAAGTAGAPASGLRALCSARSDFPCPLLPGVFRRRTFRAAHSNGGAGRNAGFIRKIFVNAGAAGGG